MATAHEQVSEMFSGPGFSPRFTVAELMSATGLAYSTCRAQLYKRYKSGFLKRYRDGLEWVYYKD